MRWRSAASLGAVTCACVSLAGCGSSGSGKLVQTTTQHARATPVQSAADVGQAVAQQPGSAVSAKHGGRHANDLVGRAHSQTGHLTDTSNDDRNTQVADPCRLVSLATAQAIAGSGITTRVEAPLGPTCIYRGAETKRGITLAVEWADATQATRQLSRRTKVHVAGREAYCGQLGTSMLIVPLAHGQLLNISGPCGVAKRFAVTALRNLAA